MSVLARGGRVSPLVAMGDTAAAGGKAARLARALALDLPVPAAVVVRSSAVELPPLDLPSTDDAAHVAAAARRFGDAVRARGVDPRLLDELEAALAPRAPLAQGWIVRSSAVGEDGSRASFAGQLDSVGPVSTRAALAAALVEVIASYGGARALTYQRARGVRLRGLALLVQRWVPPARAGVLFTRDPSGGEHAMLVEWVDGPGEALVQGRTDPARRRLARGGHVGDDDGLPAGTLRDLALALERAFGAPQDVEFVVDDVGAVWVVQSRDQTDARSREPARRWTNANLTENFPGPVTPLLASVAATGYEHLFRELGRAFGVPERRLFEVEHALRHLTGVHGGRLYYDLTSIRDALQAAPFGHALQGLFERYVGAPRAPAAPAAEDRGAAPRRGGWRDAAGAARAAVRIAWLYRDLDARVARFEATVDAYARETTPERLRAASQAELVRRLRGFVDVRTRWTDAGLADVAAMVTSGLLGRLLERALPGRQEALLARLLAGLEDVASARPVAALWDVSRLAREPEAAALLAREPDDRAALATLPARLRAALDEWVVAWGFRCSGELMLTTPTFQDEPWRALALVRAYARDGGEPPAARAAAQATQRRAAEREVEAALGRLTVPAFRALLAATRGSILARERARQRQALLYSRLRAVTLALGERLAARGLLRARDDVWFLSWQELDGLAAGGAFDPGGVRDVAALRRARHARWPAHVPEVVELAAGDVWDEAAELTRGGDPDEGATVLTGTGASPGRVTAPARVLDDVAQAGRLRRGDVLVVRQTDPGWAAALFLAGALVVERGGLLSHGAIVAREFGLPSVVGVRDATRRIPDGHVVTVDGDAARVVLA